MGTKKRRLRRKRGTPGWSSGGELGGKNELLESFRDSQGHNIAEMGVVERRGKRKYHAAKFLLFFVWALPASRKPRPTSCHITFSRTARGSGTTGPLQAARKKAPL